MTNLEHAVYLILHPHTPPGTHTAGWRWVLQWDSDDPSIPKGQHTTARILNAGWQETRDLAYVAAHEQVATLNQLVARLYPWLPEDFDVSIGRERFLDHDPLIPED